MNSFYWICADGLALKRSPQGLKPAPIAILYAALEAPLFHVSACVIVTARIIPL
ncbi:MAG TPA: hypothetical protein VKR60_05330 [Candidatus Sulfotelmatobacter sp.]|nr:hypothetical protein [Candidatus Sulfotelmatobacter sp.]